MKIKVCPKCGSENKETNESCSSCYASLGDVELTDSTIEQAEPSSAETPAPAPSGYAPTPGPTARPPGHTPIYRERPAPVRQGSGAGLVVFILILFAGGAFGGWWFFLRSPSPGEVVKQFVRAAEDRDADKIKSYLSQSTLNAPGFAEGFARGKELAANIPKPEEVKHERVKILSTTYEGAEKNTAIVTCEPEDNSKAPSVMGMDSKQEVVLVKEEGKWRVDLVTTLQRAVQKALREMGGTGCKMPDGGPTGP